MMLRRTDELAELLWDHGGPALRRPPPPPPFQPFTCGAAGSSRAHELKRHAAAGAVAVPLGMQMQMHDDGPTAPLGIPVHDDDDDVPPWLHCPAVGVGVDAAVDDDDDTAPLPPDYCASLLSDYSAPTPAAHAPPEDAAAPKQAATPAPSAEGVVNFTFFSRPLQRPQQPGSGQSHHGVESAAAAAATNRLRSTPLFSDQRMAWLQPPKAPRAAVAVPPAPPPPPPQPLVAPPPDHRHGVGEAAATVTQSQTHHHRLQPEARCPDAAAVTTSSVCSGNGDRSQAKRSFCQQQPTDGSVSQDEEQEQELDDEGGGAARRPAASRSSKRSRTAEVHNLSERRRRDRINEKMRALQELIPNCNKIDKASMLEEAIEYLKTLQLQVQMMSMGTAGLCVPPMLVPAAAMVMPPQYPMAAAAAAHCFPHHHHHHQLGLGLGFGAAAAFDMLPLPRHFPCPPMAMPAPGHVFGVPAGAPPAMFAAHASAGCAAPPEQQQMDASAARRAAEHPPPAPAAAAQAQKPQEHPKPTS